MKLTVLCNKKTLSSCSSDVQVIYCNDHLIYYKGKKIKSVYHMIVYPLYCTSEKNTK